MKRQIRLMAFNRPEHTQQCVEHLLRCRDLEHWEIVASIDSLPGGGHNEDVVEACRRLPGSVILRDRCGMNRHAWLNWHAAASDGVDYLVHLEDDVVLADDALLWLWGQWDNYRDRYGCHCCFGPRLGETTDVDALLDCVREESLFVAWGTLVTQDALQWLLNRWKEPRVELGRPAVCWDTTLSEIFAQHGWKTLTPVVTRSRNIGFPKDHPWHSIVSRPLWSDSRR